VEIKQPLVRFVMSNDVVKRTRRALEPAVLRDNTQPVGRPVAASGPELLARARAKLAESRKAFLMTSTATQCAELVRLPMTCSATGVGFILVAERNGNELRFVGHEMPRTKQEGEHRPGLLSGEYRIEMKNGWACPICKSGAAANHAWVCHCTAMRGALHCGGTHGRARYCACGRLEERHLENVETIQVRGESVAARAGTARSGSQHHGQPQTKQVTYDR
jgi:hypothetical protein